MTLKTETMRNVNEIKILFYEKICKIDKPTARMTKRVKTQQSKIIYNFVMIMETKMHNKTLAKRFIYTMYFYMDTHTSYMYACI